MRAVSFFGPLPGMNGRWGGGGADGGCGRGIGADTALLGAGDGLPLNTGGGVTGLEGGGGNGECAIGGRMAAPGAGAGGRIGPGRGGGAPFPGGRGGRLIRTVSRRGCAPAEASGRGGKLIRTVSFLGSDDSAIILP
jgi:translation initiation factor IF-2